MMTGVHRVDGEALRMGKKICALLAMLAGAVNEEYSAERDSDKGLHLATVAMRI